MSVVLGTGLALCFSALGSAKSRALRAAHTSSAVGCAFALNPWTVLFSRTKLTITATTTAVRNPRTNQATERIAFSYWALPPPEFGKLTVVLTVPEGLGPS